MASTTSNHSDPGPLYDPSQYAVEEVGTKELVERLTRAEEKYNTLLQRWKEEQQLRLKAESDRGVLAAQIVGLQAKLRRVMDATQELRALL